MDLPTFTSLASTPAIAENSGAGQAIYTAEATDDSGVTYTLKSVGDFASFTIDGSTGVVTLIGDPDYESQYSYSFTVVATDGAGNSSEQSVTLPIIIDTDGDGVSDADDPFPNEPLELDKLGPTDFQPKGNVGWIEVTYAYLNGQTLMPGIWHPIAENLGAWFAFDDSWPPHTAEWPRAWTYYWNSEQQTSTNSAGDVGDWSHYKTSNPNIYTCKFDWTNGTNGYGFTYDGRIDLDNDGNQDGIQIRSGLQFPAEGSQLDFNQILNALADNLGLFALPANFTPDDYDGDGTINALDIDDDNDGIADSYDPTALVYTVSNTSVPSSLSGYVEVFFSDYHAGYGVWYGDTENSSINIWYEGGDHDHEGDDHGDHGDDHGGEDEEDDYYRFNQTYSWDSQSLISTIIDQEGGGIFRVNLKEKTNDAFFRFTYVWVGNEYYTDESGNEYYPDESGKGFFYDGRIDLDNNGVADGVQIQSGASFPDSESNIDFRNIYNLALSNYVPIEALNYSDRNEQDIVNDVISKPWVYDLYSRERIKELSMNSTIVDVSNNQATIDIQMEESSDLETWTETGDPATMVVPADTDTKFFRFKMAE